MKMAWGLDGAGHLLPECMELLAKNNNLDLFISSSAERVLSLYGLEERLYALRDINFIRDKSVSHLSAGRFSRGEYCMLVLAPASSNSVAKFVCGISDSLTTNLFAYAGKSKTKTIVLPTDTKNEIDSLSPSGMVKVYPRRIDLKNVERLRRFENVCVVESVKELEKTLRRLR